MNPGQRGGYRLQASLSGHGIDHRFTLCRLFFKYECFSFFIFAVPSLTPGCAECPENPEANTPQAASRRHNT